MQFINFVVGIGTVEAFKIFAAAFLGRTGYLLADKLFNPIKESERKLALEKEKASRVKHGKKLESRDPLSDEFPLDESFDIERCGQFGEKMILADHEGGYTIQIYIKEVKESHRITFNFETTESKEVREWVEDRSNENVFVVRETSVSYPVIESTEELQKILNENFSRILKDLKESKVS